MARVHLPVTNGSNQVSLWVILVGVIWLFSNGADRLAVNTFLDAGTGEFVIDVERPNALTETYRFANEQQCTDFLAALEADLTKRGWKQDAVTVTGQTGFRRQQDANAGQKPES